MYDLSFIIACLVFKKQARRLAVYIGVNSTATYVSVIHQLIMIRIMIYKKSVSFLYRLQLAYFFLLFLSVGIVSDAETEVRVPSTLPFSMSLTSASIAIFFADSFSIFFFSSS